MTETRHALVLALAMGAMGLLQGQGIGGTPDPCRTRSGMKTNPDSRHILAANEPNDRGSGQCATPMQATTPLAGKR